MNTCISQKGGLDTKSLLKLRFDEDDLLGVFKSKYVSKYTDEVIINK